MTIDANGPVPDASDVLATRTSNLALSELRAGDVLANRFRIESLLGVGGYGVVYRARDLTLNVDVAVKLLRPELARRPEAFERFRDELLLARQVSSAHVVRIHDIAVHDGYAFISMDFVDGESLEHRLLRTGKLPVDDAISITHGLLEGLAAAHQREVIHRDMKPANVLLDSNGQAFITDFGVARSLAATAVTRTGSIVGTPEYLSPEQARGETVDARSDLYAVGLMLYEMLTGALPFSGGTPAETVIQRIVRPPPSLAKACPALPPWLHAFSDRLLKTNPGHRFATAKAALHALETRHVPRLPVNRRLILLSLLLLALIAGGGAWFWQHPAWRAALTQATRVAAIPRIAVLPIRATNDAEIDAIARAIDEHAQIWLRAAAVDASVPRRRVLDALARQTPGMSEAALLRQLPEIASTAGANRVLHGNLMREGAGLQLDLSLWSAGLDGPVPVISIHAHDAAALFAAYTRDAMSLWESASIHPGQPPPMPSARLVAIGTGLLALDQGNAEEASREFADVAQHDPAYPIVNAALLHAQELAHQESAAQGTRDRILAQPANDSSPLGRELHAVRVLAVLQAGVERGAP
ncbi:MAG: serine/threonine-protein kinase, partial [Dokdonella sp.]